MCVCVCVCVKISNGISRENNDLLEKGNRGADFKFLPSMFAFFNIYFLEKSRNSYLLSLAIDKEVGQAVLTSLGRQSLVEIEEKTDNISSHFLVTHDIFNYSSV